MSARIQVCMDTEKEDQMKLDATLAILTYRGLGPEGKQAYAYNDGFFKAHIEKRYHMSWAELIKWTGIDNEY